MTDYFSLLCQHLNIAPDRRGECHVTCPSCGKEPKRGQAHFSFSEKGAHCFVCGLDIGLKALAGHYGLTDGSPVAPLPRVEAAPQYHYDILEHEPDRLAAQYAAHPEAVARWQAYKPLPAEVITRYQLGYGRLPRYSSRCQHERLIVPLLGSSGHVVGFRARSAGCDCGKWLSPAGSQMVLFNMATLAFSAGEQLWIVENPIDALLLEQRYPVKAVATMGVTIWHDEWTHWIVAAKPRRVVVAYDHDVPGNGGTPEMRRRWAEEHNGKVMPSNGARLANTLLTAGLPAVLLPWPEDAPEKADIGQVLGRIDDRKDSGQG